MEEDMEEEEDEEEDLMDLCVHFFNSRDLARRAVILLPDGVKLLPSRSLAAASAAALVG